MKNILISVNNDTSSSVCICDDTGVHYQCPTCGKHYEDELEATLCCLE